MSASQYQVDVQQNLDQCRSVLQSGGPDSTAKARQLMIRAEKSLKQLEMHARMAPNGGL